VSGKRPPAGPAKRSGASRQGKNKMEGPEAVQGGRCSSVTNTIREWTPEQVSATVGYSNPRVKMSASCI